MDKSLTRFAKRYAVIFIGSLLAVLLFELIFYPLGSGQLPKDAEVKETTGSLFVLTGETPQLQIYHRAFLLPRYRLDRALEVTEGDFIIGNRDWFQVCAVSVEDSQIVLYAQENNATPYFLLISFLIFTILLYQTWDIIRQKRRSGG